ncbi:MAG: EscU/YscU/HrcU family type III secretion system export apparatus switch protein [Desulfobacteraceae bacterium]|nr:EscU/YscU/HrcU family type III secretion system export apparatus switch protein [Desulfobacteraceae bacterium]
MEERTRNRKKAVAIHYDAQKDSAPKLTAKGKGFVAEKILEIARAAGVPVRQDSDLVEVLSHLELNAEIPSETYVVVAEILAWVYRLNSQNLGCNPSDGAK